jgi:hypothetical protein
MKSLLFRLLLVALVVAGCSSGDEEAVEDDAVTENATEDLATRDGDANALGLEMAVDSALAFVDTATGDELSVAVDANAPEPTAIEVSANPATGRAGTVGTDGVATVAYVLWSWDGDEVERSSETADRLSVKLGDPSDAPPDAVVLPSALEAVLDGQPVGSRITALFPAGTTGLPRSANSGQAHVLVLDVLAFQTPEDS